MSCVTVRIVTLRSMRVGGMAVSGLTVPSMSVARMPMAVGNRVRPAMCVIAMLSKTAQHHSEQSNRAKRE